MTNEEAIEIITNAIQTDKMTFEQDRALALAQKSLDRQIPKKVELYKHNGDFKWENYPCPCCGEMLGLEVNKRYVKFCPNCGQALDWSDSE